jgi:nicotinic acid mononucleotide adenylyltransferase
MLLRLVFYTKDTRLKVRPASKEDDFTNFCVWDESIHYIVSETSNFMMVWTSLLPDLDPQYAMALTSLVGARYPLSPNYKKLKSECSQLVFQHPSDEWVVFGGTFNPWHKGHQACLSLLPDDKVCFVAPDRNPQKDDRSDGIVSCILEINTRAQFKDLQSLVPSFLLFEEKNPTINWVERLKTEFPGQKISLLMGFDSFSQMRTWIRSPELFLKLHTIYVVSRMEDDVQKQLALDEALVRNPQLTVHFLGKHEHEHLSSTEIRNRR